MGEQLVAVSRGNGPSNSSLTIGIDVVDPEVAIAYPECHSNVLSFGWNGATLVRGLPDN